MREELPSRPDGGATAVESTPRALLGERGSRGGWPVTFATAGTGLVLGVLCIWSVVKGGISASWGWSHADMALPYSIMYAAFAVTMVPAGRLQDRRGSRLVVLFGVFLAGLGCIIKGLGGSSVLAYVIGFGVLTGSGVGFGYSATTPAAVKWFPAHRTGLIAGIVVAGFALAPVVLAPLVAWLLTAFQTTTAAGVVEQGVSETMIVLGVAVWLVVGNLGLLIRNPPSASLASARQYRRRGAARPAGEDHGPCEMLRTLQFWLLFAMFFFGAAAGLMFISVASDLGTAALGSWAFLAVIVLAAGNASGRILAGSSRRRSRAGRRWRGWLPPRRRRPRDTGRRRPAPGRLFAAFGTAGLIMPCVNGWITDARGSSTVSYAVVIGLMVAGAFLAQVSRLLGRPGVLAARTRVWALPLTDGRLGGLKVFKDGEACRLAGPARYSSEVAL